MNWLAVGCGAAIGAWLRWLLGISLNSMHAVLPYGTLAANLAGGFMIGMAVAFFERYPGVPEVWRLFAVTGFLGGLTTFSTFSAEAMILLQRGQYGWAMAHIGLHLVGSIVCCIAGFAAWRALGG